jgi:hypothetical protein
MKHKRIQIEEFLFNQEKANCALVAQTTASMQEVEQRRSSCRGKGETYGFTEEKNN